MSNIDKQALRGQSVEGSYYLAECGHCGEMYPSNKLNGGEPLFSGDYGECFCHLCGADDADIADCGAWGSEAVTAWNYQQKRIEALLDELEAKDSTIATQQQEIRTLLNALGQASEKRNAEQADIIAKQEKWIKDVEETMISATDRAEAAEKRIAELEAREVKLPNPHAHLIWIQAGHAPDDYWDDVAVSHSEKDKCCDGSDRYPVYALWEIKDALSAIGINIAAAEKGEAS
ncbi:TPA: ead/Ea22-like family protein [Enterobacter kobei]|nr:ead/Ea22-like family protein [Enterobacter kobei]